MRGVFVDANGSLADIFERQNKAGDPAVRVNRNADITPDQIPALLDDAEIVIIDHTSLPTEIARRCNGLKHVVFLGTGARSYMNPEELAELGVIVHLIKGYGDTAVAECAIALMWAAARGIAKMDREMR
ncbi:MAG: 3-phosphoglycerate dehydrogenase, partial [Bradyrhizobium sp.]